MSRNASVWWMLSIWLAPVVALGQGAVDEKTLREYLSKERTTVEESLREMKRHDLDIIPTPKELRVANGKFPLDKDKTIIVIGRESTKNRIAAEEINEKLKSLTGRVLDVRRSNDVTKGEPATCNLILIGRPEQSEFIRKHCSTEKINPDDLKQQGYIIRFTNDGKRVIICGKDDQGTLYGAVTFRRLMRKAYAVRANVADWPDFNHRFLGGIDDAYRILFWERKPEGDQKAREYLDWLLRHKVNITGSARASIGYMNKGKPYGATGNPSFFSPEERAWLKTISMYASERGIRLEHHQMWNIGVAGRDKNKPEYEGCIDYRGGLYCWSRDELIKKRCAEIAEYLKETRIGCVTFHCMDTSNEK